MNMRGGELRKKTQPSCGGQPGPRRPASLPASPALAVPLLVASAHPHPPAPKGRVSGCPLTAPGSEWAPFGVSRLPPGTLKWPGRDSVLNT